jgi:hypothetical protein
MHVCFLKCTVSFPARQGGLRLRGEGGAARVGRRQTSDRSQRAGTSPFCDLLLDVIHG